MTDGTNPTTEPPDKGSADDVVAERRTDAVARFERMPVDVQWRVHALIDSVGRLGTDEKAEACRWLDLLARKDVTWNGADVLREPLGLLSLLIRRVDDAANNRMSINEMLARLNEAGEFGPESGGDSDG
jgi:hypothetical protein